MSARAAGEFNHGVVQQYCIAVPTLYEDNYVSHTRHPFAMLPLLVRHYGEMREQRVEADRQIFIQQFSLPVSPGFCRINCCPINRSSLATQTTYSIDKQNYSINTLFDISSPLDNYITFSIWRRGCGQLDFEFFALRRRRV